MTRKHTPFLYTVSMFLIIIKCTYIRLLLPKLLFADSNQRRIEKKTIAPSALQYDKENQRNNHRKTLNVDVFSTKGTLSKTPFEIREKKKRDKEHKKTAQR